MRKVKSIIIDTDFGGDPDDIIALFYALKSPEVKIEAIITSDEYESNHRAIVLKRWLKSSDKKIPIFAGLDLGNRNLFMLDKYYDKRLETENVFTSKELFKILKKVSRDNGTYLSIGGLSNLGYLCKNNIKLFKKLQICIMGGAIRYRTPGRAEHNIRIDINSARYVFDSPLNIKWVLDDQTFVDELRVSKKHDFYKQISKKKEFFYSVIKTNMDLFYRKKYPRSFLHDPIALSSIFLNTVEYKKRKILFNQNGEFKISSAGKNIYVSNKINYNKFWMDFNKKISS